MEVDIQQAAEKVADDLIAELRSGQREKIDGDDIRIAVARHVQGNPGRHGEQDIDDLIDLAFRIVIERIMHGR
jgi:hypothetical protein